MPDTAPIDATAVDAILAPFGSSRTLPAEAYRSQDLFDWEQRTLFTGGWTALGRLDDLVPLGRLRSVDHGGESILVARAADGTLTAFSNVCRHRGHPLVESDDPVEARQIRCPYHSWAYRLDGSLRTAPLLTQTLDFDAGTWNLVPIRVDVLAGWIFVDLSGAAAPLAETYGNITALLADYEPERLITVARHSYEVAANWKLVIENYHECYHCTSIHPALCEVTPTDSGADYQPTGLWCGGSMDLKDHAATMSLTGESRGSPFRSLPEERRRSVFYVGLWPNLLVSAHPDYVMTHRLVPLAPDRTFVECDWLWAPESTDLPGFDPSYATDFWDITNREDWNACQRVQSATANRGFLPGPLSPMESTIYQFLSMLGQAYRGGRVRPPVVPARGFYETAG